jgi:hypothetical protein
LLSQGIDGFHEWYWGKVTAPIFYSFKVKCDRSNTVLRAIVLLTS